MAEKKLPVPHCISGGTLNSASESGDNSNKAESGKVRVFAHERGQWSLHVFADMSSEPFNDMKHLINHFENINLCSENHISFNRGYFVTRFHQISAIVDSLSKKLSLIPSFLLCLSSAKILENEDNTRIFVCLCDQSLEVSTHRKIFNLIMESVESVFSEFASPMKPYKNEPFLIHTSLAWSLPKYRNEAVALMNCVNEFLEEPLVIEVKKVNIKIGNKEYAFRLKDL